MSIELNIIDQQVQAIAERNKDLDENVDKRISKAFTLLCIKTNLDIEDEEEAKGYIFDGGGDFGLDGIFVSDVQNGEFKIKIFQTKYRRLKKDDGTFYDGNAHFPANSVQKMVLVVKSIFDSSAKIPAREDVVDKIEEIRSIVRDGCMPSVEVIFCINGLGLNDEGIAHWDNNFKDIDTISVMTITHEDIVKKSTNIKEINDSIQFSGAVLQYNDFAYKRVFMGRVNIRKLFELFEKYGDRLLEKNVRKFLGGKNTVNKQIRDTIISKDNENFFFLNNGITIVTKNVKAYLTTDTPIIKMDSINIINGGQTCKTIQETLSKNDVDVSKCYVLVRIYELDDDDKSYLLDKITLATNSQSVVNLKDLKSNDKIQKQLVESIKLLGFDYKPKREHSNSNQSISIGVAAEAIFSTWYNEPHSIKFSKNRLFSIYYDKIFNDKLNGAQLVLAVFVWRYVENTRKSDKNLRNQHYFINYASNLICMVMGTLILKQYNIQIEDITHNNFKDIEQRFNQNKETLYHKALAIIDKGLKNLIPNSNADNPSIIARHFRNAELTDEVIKIIDQQKEI